MSSASWVVFFEIIIFLACGLAAVKLAYTGLWRRYRALFAYLLFRCACYGVTLFWITDIRSAAFQKFYVLTQPIAWFLFVLIVLELYTLVLEKHKGLATLGRWFQYAGLTISLLISGAALLPRIQNGQIQASHILTYYYAIERGVDFSLLIFLVLILLWLTRYPVPLSRNLVVHSIVYSLLFFSSTVGMFARVFFGFQLSRSVSTATLAIFAACILIWLIFLTEKGEEVRLNLPQFGPEQEKRILEHLDALNSTLLKASRH